MNFVINATCFEDRSGEGFLENEEFITTLLDCHHEANPIGLDVCVNEKPVFSGTFLITSVAPSGKIIFTEYPSHKTRCDLEDNLSNWEYFKRALFGMGRY